MCWYDTILCILLLYTCLLHILSLKNNLFIIIELYKNGITYFDITLFCTSLKITFFFFKLTRIFKK